MNFAKKYFEDIFKNTTEESIEVPVYCKNND